VSRSTAPRTSAPGWERELDVLRRHRLPLWNFTVDRSWTLCYVVFMKQQESEPVVERDSPEQALTAERFEAEAAEAVAATLRGDANVLKALSTRCREAAHSLRKATSLSLDPWAEPAVAYGALLGLAETTELAARMIIRPEVLRHLVDSSEVRRILMKLAAQPGGMISQARVPALTGIHRGNAHPTIGTLEQLGLIERQAADGKETARTLELTNSGWAAIELIRAWGLADASEETPSVEQLLRARVPIRTLAERLATNPKAGWEVGRALSVAKDQDRERLCKAAGLGINGFDPNQTLQFVVELVESIKEEGSGPVGRAAGKLRVKISPKNKQASLQAIRKAFNRDPWRSACGPMVAAVQRQLERDVKA